MISFKIWDNYRVTSNETASNPVYIIDYGVMSSLNFRWRTANGPYTEYSALYPPAFGETCAFAFKIHKKYWFVPPSDLWEYAGVEIKSFVDDLYVRIPSEEQVLATAKDRLKDNSCTNY